MWIECVHFDEKDFPCIMAGTKTRSIRKKAVCEVTALQWVVEGDSVPSPFLVLLAVLLVLALALGGLGADLFVVLLERRHVFTRLGELALFHTFTNIPEDIRLKF